MRIVLVVLFLGSALFGRAVVIPIEKDIESGLVTFLKRAIADADTLNPEVIIFEVNTFGGRVDAALEIVTLISDIKTPTVAYVKEKAISAGALIALACGDLYMKENTTIGDCAPITIGQEGPKLMGEKFQSPLRAKFRALAKKKRVPG